MKKNKNELSYLEHLEELRKRIIFCFVFFIIVFIVVFLKSREVINFFEKPLRSLNLKLYFFKPYEKLTGYISISIFCSFLISLAVIFIQFMIFIYPALIGKEKKLFWFFAILIPLLFILGFIFSYFILLPISYNFLLNFSKNDEILPRISFFSHISMIIIILLSTSLIFQIPVILIMLISLGLLKVSILKKVRRYIIVITFVISAIITPPDVFSQVLLALPLYLLYELSIIIGSFIEKIKEVLWKEENLSKKH